jgi:hypothetical protein
MLGLQAGKRNQILHSATADSFSAQGVASDLVEHSQRCGAVRICRPKPQRGSNVIHLRSSLR